MNSFGKLCLDLELDEKTDATLNMLNLQLSLEAS